MKSTRRCVAGLIGIFLLFGTACSGATPTTRVDGVAGVSGSSKNTGADKSKSGPDSGSPQGAKAGVEADLQLAQEAAADAVAKAAKQLATKQSLGGADQAAKPTKGEAAQYETELRQILPAVRRSVAESVDN